MWVLVFLFDYDSGLINTHCDTTKPLQQILVVAIVNTMFEYNTASLSGHLADHGPINALLFNNLHELIKKRKQEQALTFKQIVIFVFLG